MKRINRPSYRIKLDEKYGRLFALNNQSVNVYALDTWENTHALRDLKYPNYIKINYEKQLLLVKSVNACLAVYDLASLNLIQIVKIRQFSTDCDFLYNPKSNTVFLIADKNLYYHLIAIDLNSYQVSYYLLSEPKQENIVIIYSLLRAQDDEVHIIKCVSDLSKNIASENIYQKYRLENGKLTLIEAFPIKSAVDLTFLKFCGNDAYNARGYLKTDTLEGFSLKDILGIEYKDWINSLYQAEDGRMVFLAFNEIYEKTGTEKAKIVYQGKCLSDYTEYDGYRIIGTWTGIFLEKIVK